MRHLALTNRAIVRPWIIRCTLLAITALGAACASTPKHRIPIAVVADGDRRKVELAPHAVGGLELTPFAIPNAAPKPADDATATVTRARAAYVDGNFEACRGELARVDLARLLADGQRTLAGRTLAFDAACAYGAQAKAQAEVLAAKLASLGLELPDAPLAREAETLIARAITEGGKSPRHALAVTGEIGGRLAVDGKPAGCTLPCTVDLAAGDHLLAVETDGFAPVARWVRVPDATTVALAQSAATPEIATAQWRARIGRGLPPADAVGARLLARLTAQPRVVLLHGDAQVNGTLIVDGEIRAHGEGAAAPALVRELAYDAKLLERPAIWQKPSFWIVTSVAVAVIAGAVIYAVYEPDTESNLRFP